MTTIAAMAASPTNSKTSSPNEVTGTAGDFQTFLTLLTTQLRNQDPLKPMESTEFVSQLANFSAVEQQVQTNTRLENILTALTGDSASGLADWIGKDVRSTAPTVFNGTPLEVYFQPVDGADTATLKILDAENRVVRATTVDPTVGRWTWTGETDFGQLSSGTTVRFQVEFGADGSTMATQQAETFSNVREILLENGQGLLVLDSGETISTTEISGLRG